MDMGRNVGAESGKIVVCNEHLCLYGGMWSMELREEYLVSLFLYCIWFGDFEHRPINENVSLILLCWTLSEVGLILLAWAEAYTADIWALMR